MATKGDSDFNVKLQGTLVVVDDEKIVRDYIRMVLVEDGYDVFTATSSGQCFQELEGSEKPIRLVILDRLIPGEDVVAMAQRFHREYAETPVLLTSGFNADERVEALLNEGWISFLQKPFHPSELLQEVKRLIR